MMIKMRPHPPPTAIPMIAPVDSAGLLLLLEEEEGAVEDDAEMEEDEMP